jgi:YgiT-type zinc finger domain-containing protein
MKSRRKSIESCEYCGGRLQGKRVNVYRHWGRRHILFEGVRARVCRHCGHRVFDAPAVEAMEEHLQHPASGARPARLLIIPA